MKTKLFILALISTVSFSTFATTFTKTESGSVSWDLNIKSKQGSIIAYSDSSGYRQQGEVSNYDQRIISNLPLYFGRSINKAVSFELSDERSQESVQELIASEMLVDLKGLNIRVLSKNIVLRNANCIEHGFIKKELSCGAKFKAEILIELIK